MYRSDNALYAYLPSIPTGPRHTQHIATTPFSFKPPLFGSSDTLLPGGKPELLEIACYGEYLFGVCQISNEVILMEICLKNSKNICYNYMKSKTSKETKNQRYDVFEDEILIYIEKADNHGDIYKN